MPRPGTASLAHGDLPLHALALLMHTFCSMQFALWKLFVRCSHPPPPPRPFTTTVSLFPASSPLLLIYFVSPLALAGVTVQRASLWHQFP